MKRLIMGHMVGLLIGMLATGVAVAGDVVIGTDSVSGGTVIQTSGRHPELVVPVEGAGERICWFNGQKYSKGARLQAGGDWLECTRENDYETNGSLSWRPVGAASNNTEKVQVQTIKTR